MRRPPESALLPYTTLFRSGGVAQRDGVDRQRRGAHARQRDAEGLAGVRAHLEGQAGRAGEELRAVELGAAGDVVDRARSEEHTSELQSRQYLVCRLLLEQI